MRANNPDHRILPDLADRTANHWQKEGLIVYVHGLLSTDVGLFDSLITELGSPNYSQVAFPHNTVTTDIAGNGLSLKNLIMSRNPKDSNGKVLFICHSRGGLVARSAIAELLKDRVHGKEWQERIIGCVTFGTPHHGAALAQSPTKLLSLGVIAGLAASRGYFSSVTDVLSCASTHGCEFCGITDLQPGSTFLKKLQTDEGQLPSYQLIAVGGTYKPGYEQGLKGIVNWIRWSLFGRKEDTDLVVQLKEALPDFCPPDHTHIFENCEHSQYFDEEKMRKISGEPVGAIDAIYKLLGGNRS